jgi:Ethanolamine utilization protein EutJ (predicted chaperonin)
MSGSKGLDIGTNMLVAAMLDEEGNPIFKDAARRFLSYYTKN